MQEFVSNLVDLISTETAQSFQSIESFFESIFTAVMFPITVISVLLNAVATIKKRIRSKRERNVLNPREIVNAQERRNAQKKHAALVIDLSRHNPSEMIDQIKASIRAVRRLKPLNTVLLSAPVITDPSDFRKMNEPDSSFSVEYHAEKGRFITITTDKDMPSDTEGASKYIEKFVDTIGELVAEFKHHGISTIHIFYRGPLPLYAYLGIRCSNEFLTYYYHFDNQNGMYYLLSSGEIARRAKQK